VKSSGKIPAPISHLSGFLVDNTFNVYGGLQGADSNSKIYSLNLDNNEWKVIESGNEAPIGRDDHAACFDEETKTFYVFGGYVDGDKANDLWKYDTANNTWTELKDNNLNDDQMPVSRIGAAIVMYNNVLYLFGGHDDNNEKINDMWKYDLASNAWT
jgi:N-acetylneuraminic acid mutarotase